MRDFKKIPQLHGASDMLEKARFDMERFKADAGVYSLTDCLLTLNAIPEWMGKDHPIVRIMTCEDNDPVYGEFLESIEQQLRFIRCFSNHTKHNSEKKPIARIDMYAELEASFPITFDQIGVRYQCGKKGSVSALLILENTIKFFEAKIAESR